MFDALRGRYRQRVNRFRAGWEESLFFRISTSMIATMLAMAILFSAVTCFILYYSINLKESAALKSRLDLVSSDMEHKLNYIISDTVNLAGNTLVENAIVDTYGRDAYLIPFFMEHKIADNLPHKVGLCDFQGTVIASNGTGRRSFADAKLLDAIVGKGKPLSVIERDANDGEPHLVIFQPVRYQATGTTEGFLFIEVLLKDIFGGDYSNAGDVSISIFQDKRLILGKSLSSGASLRKRLALSGVAAELGISVEVRSPRSLAMVWCVLAMLVITILLGRLIIRISFRISDNLTTRLVILNEAARSISESGIPDRKVERAGIDEIGRFADAFNSMVDQLRESYDALESRVEERTRLLAEANETLIEEIEQRLEAECRLQELNSSLEATVQSEIEQHREKERMLIQQNRLASMGEMIGNIAHQWRQPLNNVGLIVQSIEMEHEAGLLTGESLKEQVDSCMASIKYMSSTIDDFRNFFRPDKEKHPFSVIDAVSRTVTLIRPTLNNYDIRLKISDHGSGDVFGYENEFGQVLMNLLNNAKDVMLERKINKPLIEISCSRENGRSLVVVADNGGGIEESLINKVFDPYFTTKFQSQGTGIGLYMAKIIIEKNMGGILTVNNTPSGAEFRIEI